MQTVSLKKILKEYKDQIQNRLNKGEIKNVDKMIEISQSLFHEIKVEGIPVEEVKDSDMLLFQYGTYDWGKGDFFEFNITRQFMEADEDEPYQLSMTLYFDPIECKSYNCWSSDFGNLEEWVENIKETEGYKSAKNLTCKKFKIVFYQC